ncbi:unnamed protein product, partial [Choristocarpus tenellus]
SLQHLLEGGKVLPREENNSGSASVGGVPFLRRFWCPLKVVRLGRNQIGDNGAIALANVIKQRHAFRFEELDLTGNNIGLTGASAILQALSVSS